MFNVFSASEQLLYASRSSIGRGLDFSSHLTTVLRLGQRGDTPKIEGSLLRRSVMMILATRLDRYLRGTGSLSKILCVRHNMSQRSMYATQTEGGRCGREGIAINS